MHDAFEQMYAGPFRTAILQMLARPHEFIHTLAVRQNLFTTSGRHRILLNTKKRKGAIRKLYHAEYRRASRLGERHRPG